MIYGSLSTLAIFFLLVYYSSAILILGGEVAFLLEGRRLCPPVNSNLKKLSNNPKGRIPRALPVGEWELAHRASSIACVLE